MTRSCMEHVKDFFHPYLLPLKAISFLLVGAPASIVPYIPIFNRNLGLNAAENGIIFGALPFLSILSRPTAGTLLDKLRAHRVILRVFLLTELLFISSIYFIPALPQTGVITATNNVTSSTVEVGETWLNVTRDELNGVPGFITNNSAEVVDTFHPSLVLIENTSKEISARNDKAYVRWTLQFWLTGLLLVIGWFGYGAANTSLDVIALHIVDASPVRTSYGGNRVFGTVGFGVFALLAGQLMDTFSHTAEGRDFTPAFVTFFVASSGTVLLTFLLPKTHETSLSSDPEKKEEQVSPGGSPLSVFFTPDVILFWSGIFVVGICTGMLRSCIPWFLAELGADGLLVGMNFFIQCMYETPIMAVSGWIIRKLGFHTCMLLALLAFGVRFVALYFLLDPWYILLINLTHVFCFGLFYASMMGFAFEKAPPGTRGTLQGILSGTFSGVGQGIGGLTAGFIYQAYGGRTAWLSFGILALVTAFFYCIGMLALWRRERNVKVTVL